jgi:hypothetical protein
MGNEEMNELLPIDLRRVVAWLPKDVVALLKKEPLFLAGGYVRATVSQEKPSDIDLFGPDKERLDRLALELAHSRKGRKHDTDNAYTVLAPGRTPVQMIHRWLYGDAERLVGEFDYTVARACVWWADDKWKSLVDERFYPDLAARRLVYCSPKRKEDAGGSLLRARKFLRQGWFIDAQNLGAVVARLCSSVDWKQIPDEAQLAVVLTALLREVDPLIVIDGLDLVDEHQK